MRLFKYLHPDRIDVIQKARMRFSPPHAFNDPFDLKPNIQGFATRDFWNAKFREALPKIVEEQYAELPSDVRALVPLSTFQVLAEAKFPSLEAESFEFSKFIAPHIRLLMESKFEELVGILCFTEKPDNLLMWAHYADSHQGFVIEVDSTDAFFNQRRSKNDEFFFLRKVQYAENRPTLNLSEIETFDTFLTKGLDWEYEQEWRMLAPLPSATEVISMDPIDVHLFAFPKAIIKSVICGARISDKTKHELVVTIKSDPAYHHVRIQQAIIDKSRYRIYFEDIKV